MLPMLRTGFVLLPPGLRDAVIAARQLGDGYGQVAVQVALARFIDEGHLARHVRRAGKAYGNRRARILAALAELPRLRVLPSAAGLHVTALLRDGTPAEAARVSAAALASGVAVEDLTRYSDTHAGFVFGFGAITPALIEEGLAIFARLLR
jgi:GntR family transcriptional regulator/MocR family aminotransferase